MKQTVGIKELGKRSIELGSATLLGAILVLSPHLIATAATTKSQCEGVFASDAKAKPAKRFVMTGVAGAKPAGKT